jgi:hypothetical protein
MVDIADLFDEAEAEKAARATETQRFIELSNAFVFGVDSLRWMSKRHRTVGIDTLTFRLTDDLLESAIAASTNVESGALNPAKRELRYILEQSVKYAFVDQRMQKHPVEKKLTFLQFRDIELVDAARDVGLFVPDAIKETLLNELGPLYGQLSEFVHPSHRLADDRIRRSRSGHYIGSHTVKDVREVNSLAKRVFDIGLLYCCQPLGPSLVGDVMLNSWEDVAWWPFHYTPYMRALSDLYDYKDERRDDRSGPMWRRVVQLLGLLSALHIERVRTDGSVSRAV